MPRVPIYLHTLGLDGYGIVAFYSVFAAFAAITDFGLTPTLSRQLAAASGPGKVFKRLQLITSFERAYWAIAAVVSVAILGLGALVARFWLGKSFPEGGHSAFSLMGFALALQLLAGMYTGGLMALEHQVKANVIVMIATLVRTLGAALLIRTWWPTAEAFVVTQIVVNAVASLVARKRLLGVAAEGTSAVGEFSWALLRSISKYAFGIAALGALSVALAQADKVIVSGFTTIAELACYGLAATIAAVGMYAAVPVSTALFPRLARQAEAPDEMLATFQLGAQLIAVAVVPLCCTLGMFSDWVLLAWTGSDVVAAIGCGAATLLILAQMLQALTLMPFQVLMASGRIKGNVWLQIVCVAVLVPCLIFATRSFGITGAAGAWLLVNVLSLPIYINVLFAGVLPGAVRGVWLHGIGLPIALCIPICAGARLFLGQPGTRFSMIACAGAVYVICFLLCALGSPRVRAIVMKYANLR